eukprot:13532547-Alexandrium_andersonii.AAC.1
MRPVDVTSPSPEHSPAAAGAAAGSTPAAVLAAALNDPRKRAQALNRVGRQLAGRQSDASLILSQESAPDWAGPETSPTSAPPPAAGLPREPSPTAASVPAGTSAEPPAPPVVHPPPMPEETARPAGPIRIELIAPPEAAPGSSAPAAATAQHTDSATAPATAATPEPA